MTIRFVTLRSRQGRDRLMTAIRGDGSDRVEFCDVFDDGDGSIAVAVLEARGRQVIAARAHQWERWEPVR